MDADRVTLGVAHALEQLFAADPALARPVPRREQTLARRTGG